MNTTYKAQLQKMGIIELSEIQRTLMDINLRNNDLLKMGNAIFQEKKDDEAYEQAMINLTTDLESLKSKIIMFEDVLIEIDEIIGNKVFSEIGVKENYTAFYTSTIKMRDELISLFEHIQKEKSGDGPKMVKLE